MFIMLTFEKGDKTFSFVNAIAEKVKIIVMF
jgi:hypothetical protein